MRQLIGTPLQTMSITALVGVQADRSGHHHNELHTVMEKYLVAVLDAAGAMPLVIPALGERLPLELLVDRLDGFLFTGAYSNIEPHHYDGGPSYEGNLHDPHRDATTLKLLPLAIARGVPVLGICRGFQEMNVALGGSLHQKVHEVEGLNDHRERPDSPPEEHYAPAHPVAITPGGLLHRLSGVTEAMVNTIHGQGIHRLAPGLTVEARAPDGLIEAISLPSAENFVFAVQWHPEWEVLTNPFYLSIFKAFGDACRARARARQP